MKGLTPNTNDMAPRVPTLTPEVHKASLLKRWPPDVSRAATPPAAIDGTPTDRASPIRKAPSGASKRTARKRRMIVSIEMLVRVQLSQKSTARCGRLSQTPSSANGSAARARVVVFDLLDVLTSALGSTDWPSSHVSDTRKEWRREWARRDETIQTLATTGVCASADFVRVDWKATDCREAVGRRRPGGSIAATPRGCVEYLNAQLSRRKAAWSKCALATIAKLSAIRDRGELWTPE